MDKQPVGQLPDLTQSNNDDEIMVITNSEYNQLKKEKISDFITDLTSTDENNAIVKGTDGKLFTKDFGNASNITEGTLPVSVLPDIPKDKLPEIETDDLPDSGITAGTYTYPTDIVVNSKGQVTSITEGQAGANNANQDLSNLGPLGLDKLNQSKALETGSVSSDADVYADVLKYKNSGNKTGIDVIKPDNYEVVGSPNITDDGIASGFQNQYYLFKNITIDPSDDFDIIISFKLNQLTNLQYIAYIIGLGAFRQENNIIAFNVLSSSTTPIIPYFPLINNLQIGIKYYCRVKKVGNNYTVSYKTKDIDWIIVKDVISDLGGETISNVYLGNSSNLVSPLSNGEIDLNDIQVYVNGDLVYQPCLKIPYTLSKTGSKIVDAAYRDRVEDLYQQNGEALYYTIDEENQNFTLPMGEIYGMIENCQKGGLPVGMIFGHTCSADFVPEKSLPCDGTEYSKSQFNNLYTDWLVAGRLNTCTYEQYQQDITTYGKCAKWGLDTTNQKFKVPTIPDGTIIQQAMTDDELGKSYNAGLPNIEGQIGAPTDTTYTEQSGALSRTTTGGNLFDRDADGGICTYSALIFDASLSNPIYGNSDTVQQNAVALRYFVVVATGSINQSLMDWSTWATGLQGKLNADHSNDTKPYITEAYVNDTSGYLVYSNGYCEQWGLTNASAGSSITINYIKTFKDTNYFIAVTSRNNENDTGGYQSTKIGISGNSPYDFGLLTTGFRASTVNESSTKFAWKVSGYLASGEY